MLENLWRRAKHKRRFQLRSGVLALVCLVSFGLTSGLGNAALALWEPANAQAAGGPILAQSLSPDINPYDVTPPLESEPLELEPRTQRPVSPPPPPPPLTQRPNPQVGIPAAGEPLPPSPAPVWGAAESVPAPSSASQMPVAKAVANPTIVPAASRGATAARPPAQQQIQAQGKPAGQPGGQPINITPPGNNMKPGPDMVRPKPQRPQFPALPRQEVRGVWMTTNDMEILLDRDRLGPAMAQLAQLNFNTVYPVVWNSGYALHPSAVASRVGSPRLYYGKQGQDPLAEVIYQGHRNGISVMPWFEFGFMVPESSELALAHPDWLSVKANGDTTANSAGGENAWLNPLKPEVQKFLTDLVMEVVDQYDVDGIQFDDHMSLPRDFGYDSYTKALYQKETGKPVPANSADGAWMRWRADKITEFIGDLHDAVKTRKPKTVFSVSPNYQDFAYKFSLQDWLSWVRQDLVDEIVMQVYRDDYNSFVEQIERAEIKESQQKISTGIGILSGLPRRQIPMGQVEAQSRAAQQRGLGIAYFYYKSLWDYAPEPVGERQAGFAQIFPRSASRLAQLAR